MSLPMTYWLIAGSSEYAATNLPGVDGATADCLGVRDDLLRFGYSDSQVLAFCGEEMRKAEIVQAVTSLSDRLHSGDTLVIFWIGHGGFDLDDPGQKLWQTFDGVFARETEDGNGYGMSGIDPRLLEAALRRRLPDTEVLFLTDTARGGIYEQVIDLRGPTAEDFQDLSPHTRSVSYISGSGSAGGLRSQLSACLARHLAMAEDGRLSSTEAATCLGLSASPVIMSAGSWSDPNLTLIWYPPLPKLAKKPLKLRPVVRFGGLGIGLASAALGGLTFAEADAIYADAQSQGFEVSPDWQPNEQRYEELRLTTYALWGASLVGFATFGGSYLTVTPTPQGLAISGAF